MIASGVLASRKVRIEEIWQTTPARVTNQNNFTGRLGFAFKVGPQGMTITHMGRWKRTGNVYGHNLHLINLSNGLMASTYVDMSTGQDESFVYATITPFYLPPGVECAIVSEELNGFDTWSEVGTGVMRDDFIPIGPCYAGDGAPGNLNVINDGLPRSYGPVSFKYSNKPAPAPIGDAACYAFGPLGPVRNDYPGHLGFKFTPTVGFWMIAHRRWMLGAGDSQAHPMDLTLLNGTILQSSVVNNAGQPGGFWVDGTVDKFYWCAPGVTYALMSTEYAGGDSWYEGNTGYTPSPKITMEASIFDYNIGVYGNYSYVPVDFYIYTYP